MRRGSLILRFTPPLLRKTQPVIVRYFFHKHFRFFSYPCPGILHLLFRELYYIVVCNIFYFVFNNIISLTDYVSCFRHSYNKKKHKTNQQVLFIDAHVFLKINSERVRQITPFWVINGFQPEQPVFSV